MANFNDPNLPRAPLAGRMLATVFGITFGGIGLAVMVFLWTGGGIIEPPLFFKIFGTLIALPFIAIGALTLLGGLTGKGVSMRSPVDNLADQVQRLRDELPEQPGVGRAATNYTCPHCAAPLASSSDASPHGDVKCRHCDTWFNIYGK